MELSITNQEQISQKFFESYKKIEDEYLELIAKQLNDIGKLNSTNIKKLDQIIIMNGNVDYINNKIAALTKKSVKEIEKELINIAKEQYLIASKFYLAAGVIQVSIEQNIEVMKKIKAIAKMTNLKMINISRTTAKSLNYIKAIDDAILAVTSNVVNYNTAIRKVIRSQSVQGISFVEYESGYKRRLDSAVRMNVMDGMHQVNLGVAKQTGEEFGADGVEITSHNNPAPDHKNIDGEIYSNKEFEKLQKKLDRPIGELNCYHFALPIILGISSSTFTQEERKKKRKDENKKYSFGEQSKTKYEWGQEQRKIETKVRYQKDVLIMAKKVNDNELITSTKGNIKILKQKYEKLSNGVGIEMQKYRF